MSDNRQRGASVGEVMVLGVIVVFVFAAVTRGCDFVTADTVRERATADALKMTREVRPSWRDARATCQGVDSDGDGYVRCLVVNGSESEALDCRATVWLDYARGCVPMRAVGRINGGER